MGAYSAAMLNVSCPDSRVTSFLFFPLFWLSVFSNVPTVDLCCFCHNRIKQVNYKKRKGRWLSWQERAHLENHGVKVHWRVLPVAEQACKAVPWFEGGFV